VSDRILTPHELHQKAISVLDQLERIAHDWRRGRLPALEEIDVVTVAVVELRGRIEATARDASDAGPAALEHLAGARRRIVEAQRLVRELAVRPPSPAADEAAANAPGRDGGSCRRT
jgi:hypothetical protein